MLATIILIGGLIGAVLYYQFPQHFPNWFMGIMAFFIVFELLEVWYIEHTSLKENPRQLINSYLLTKIAKMFGSILFVALYASIVGEGLKKFVFVFIIFYIIFLFVETLIFMRIEKRLKKKKEKAIE